LEHSCYAATQNDGWQFKGGHMFAIAVVFLVGTLALWLFGAIEG
jgi:hypothetical protein